MSPARRPRKPLLALAALAAVGSIATVAALGLTAGGEEGLRATEAEASPARSDTEHPVTIRRPDGPPRVVAGEVDALGRPVTASCDSCHATREPDRSLRDAEALEEFHRGLTFVHGDLTCMSCHNESDYDTLRLADGSAVRYEDVMTLCSQCHGPQARDYDNGAHGGMNGYWDLARGPRVRNNCVDCHDPHAPAFPKMKPTFKPRDRFLERPGTEHTVRSDAHDEEASHE